MKIFLEGGKGNNCAAIVGKGRETETRLVLRMLNIDVNLFTVLVSQLLCVHKLTLELLCVSVKHQRWQKNSASQRLGCLDFNGEMEVTV